MCENKSNDLGVILMSIKLFVTDLDGTLLPTGTRVSEKNIRAVRDMVEAGVIFTLATGRMYRAAFAIAKSLRVDVPLITYNGALIKSTSGEVIHEDCLPQDLILELIDFCRLNGWHVQTYDDDILRFAELNRLAESYMASVKVEGAAVGWDGLKKYSARSYKLLLVTDGDAASKDCIVELKKMFDQRMDSLNELLKAQQQWCRDHIEYALLISNIFMILAAGWVFRFSPRMGKLTLVESFYAQMYIDCQMMLITIPYTLITWQVYEAFILPYLLPFPITLIVLIYDYYQLCGFTLWGTIWRLAMMLITLLSASIFLSTIGVCLYLFLPLIGQ